MDSTFLTTVLLPVALGVIMLGLGLSLTPADFRRVFTMPRAVLVGLACQMLLLPAVALGIATGMVGTPELAVGIMLLAASPGGATANLFSHLSEGDVALNITLTATNSILSLLTLPIIVNLSLSWFLGQDSEIGLQLGKVIEVVVIVLLPVSIGMFIRNRNAGLAARLDKPVKILSAVFLIAVILAAVAKERANLPTWFVDVGLACLVFNLASMAVGYVVPRLLGLPTRSAVAIGMEIGIHNGTLAIYIAQKLLGNTTMAVPAAIYSLIMFFTAGAFGAWARKQVRAEAAAV